MKYRQIVEAVFLERPNRFIAYVDLLGKKETVHVKNTGRCRELLQKGAKVYLEEGAREGRKTAYDLVAVKKGGRIINMDSQAPNRAVEEWLRKKELFPELTLIKPEVKYKNSRFDFYIECGEQKIFMEVKGVTLEEGGVVSFPDAPSDRAVKHLKELMEAQKDGYQACVMFVIQMKDVDFFIPNGRTQPEFAAALREAADAGVRVLAYDCAVTPQEMRIDSPVRTCIGGRGELAGSLLSWYDGNRRILPWREDPAPYKVWISEIMLQQTRVEAVKPYFERFMSKLPDIRALADAQEETLLKLWEGLGYYNRVRNLQKAARIIMEEYGGQMPDSFEALKNLPGIGSYTAGAIASIAFGKPEPAVDGNVLRVMARLVMEPGDVLSQRIKRQTEDRVRKMIPPERAGDFTQALIELGALVCVPGGLPRCDGCPWELYCEAHRNGRETEFPHKTPKKERRREKKTVFLLLDGEKVALRKRPNRGLLAGMYEFPMAEGYKNRKEALAFCREAGLQPLHIKSLPETKHVFSHVEWHMKGYAVRVDELYTEETSCPGDAGEPEWLFVNPPEAGERYPIPSAFAAYTEYLNILRGNDKLIEEKQEEITDYETFINCDTQL